MIDEFAREVAEALQREPATDGAEQVLRKWRAKGLTAETALLALESLRAGADEATDDRILELMDIVAGFCAPHRRIWE